MNTFAVTNESHLVPSIAWVAGTLLPQARSQLQQCREPAVPTIAYFQSLDISWTKPETLTPFAVIPGSEESMRGLKRVREDAFATGEFDRPRPMIQRLEMAPPTLNKTEGGHDVPADLWENL